jgi:hypothetical protein
MALVDVTDGQATNLSQAGRVLMGKGTDGKYHPVAVDAGGNLSLSSIPGGATTVIGSSGNVANASAVAALAGTSGKTTYITGFQLTASGSTVGLDVTATVTGLLSSNMSFTFTFPAGALVPAQPLIVNFPQPLPASAANTAIVVTLPAGGTGNTNATADAQGFQL